MAPFCTSRHTLACSSQELLREGRLLAAAGFGTANDFGQTIAVAMLGPSADALALMEPPPAKLKRRPEDRKVREEES
jgi:hypothetical protein